MLIEGNSRYPESFILNLKLAKAYLELYELDKAAIIYDDILKKFEYKFTIKEVEAIFSDD